MARGRIIRPEIWTDSRVISLTPHARLLYIGTWNFALCDRGHLNDDALRLKLQILPADQVDGAELLEEIVAAGLAEQFAAGGESYLRLTQFEREQTASKDSRWNTRCPACQLSQTQESFVEPTRDAPPSHEFPVEGRGVEKSRVEEGGEGTPPPRSCSQHPAGTDQPCGPCRDARLAHDAWTKANPEPATADEARALRERRETDVRVAKTLGMLSDDAPDEAFTPDIAARLASYREAQRNPQPLTRITSPESSPSTYTELERRAG